MYVKRIFGRMNAELYLLSSEIVAAVLPQLRQNGGMPATVAVKAKNPGGRGRWRRRSST
jgi:hypothetical protein